MATGFCVTCGKPCPGERYRCAFCDGRPAGMPEAQAPARHPSSQKFHDLLTECGKMHDRKQADYGSDDDPFANVRATERWGMPGSLGACLRIGDKVARLQAFYRRGELANESVEDAYMDLAVYALIGLVLYREEAEKAKP